MLQGARELLPAAPGVFAWGLVTGVAMVKSGLPVGEALGLSLLAYAGSAQLAAVPLLATFAPLWLVFVTAVVVNLRFVVYSAALRPVLGRFTPGKRLALGYITGDIVFVKFSNLLRNEPQYTQPVAYYLGGSCCNWVLWQVSSIIGILLAKDIPAAWGLELAGTLALIALLVPLCQRRPALTGALVSAVVAVIAHELPMRLGLALGLVCGMATAFLVERATPVARSSAP